MSAEQLEWRDQVLAYAAKINAFAARGLSSGWDKAGPQPPEPKLDHLMGSAVPTDEALGAHGARGGRRHAKVRNQAAQSCQGDSKGLCAPLFLNAIGP